MRSCFVAASCWFDRASLLRGSQPMAQHSGEWLEKLTGCVNVTLDNRVVLAAS